MTTPSVNHVFVDFENLPQLNPGIFSSGKTVQLTLLVGARQTKLDTKLVENLLQHAASVSLVRLSSSGRDALDFTLAYYLGRAVLADPTGHFHIVSKDTGFDPLVEHLKERQVKIHRHDGFDTVTFAGSAKQQPPAKPLPQAKPQPPAVSETSVSDDLYIRALGHLRNTPKNRPKSLKTLTSHLLTFLGKGSSTAEVQSLIQRFQNGRFLSLDDKGSVTYSLGEGV